MLFGSKSLCLWLSGRRYSLWGLEKEAAFEASGWAKKERENFLSFFCWEWTSVDLTRKTGASITNADKVES